MDESASLESNRVRRIRPVGNSRTLVSGVFINSAEASERLIAGSSNLNEKTKQEAVRSINEFVSSNEGEVYSHRFKINNVFGWVGLPFLLIGVLGLVG